MGPTRIFISNSVDVRIENLIPGDITPDGIVRSVDIESKAYGVLVTFTGGNIHFATFGTVVAVVASITDW